MKNNFASRSVLVLTMVSIFLAAGSMFSAAQTLKTIYSFDNRDQNGSFPPAGVTLDHSGTLFGTTGDGGPRSCGTAYALRPNGTNWTLTYIKDFGGLNSCFPGSPLVEDSAGNLYGSTNGWGLMNGALFELSPVAGGGWRQTDLATFPNGCDCGEYTMPAPIFDQSGNVYSVSRYNGLYGHGMVYEVTPNGDGTWNELELYDFAGGADGFGPNSLIFDRAGNLFGTTTSGGTSGGTAFELMPMAGGGWQKSTIYSFGTVDADPEGLIVDKSGNLYGAAEVGGVLNHGTVFELSPDGSGGWAHKILYSFRGTASGDGAVPQSPLLFDRGQDLWGVTYSGGISTGSCSPDGCGTVFRLSPNSGGTWSEVHYDFQTDSTGPAYPHPGLVFDQKGNLYGTTLGGGTYGAGTVFELTP